MTLIPIIAMRLSYVLRMLKDSDKENHKQADKLKENKFDLVKKKLHKIVLVKRRFKRETENISFLSQQRFIWPFFINL